MSAVISNERNIVRTVARNNGSVPINYSIENGILTYIGKSSLYNYILTSKKMPHHQQFSVYVQKRVFTHS